jgi:O-antigen ligase
MILTLILALGPAARKALRLPAWLLWAPVPALAVALVLSFSRGSIVNLIVALTTLAWMRRRKIAAMRPVAAALVLVIVVSAAAIVIAPEFLAPYTSRLEFSATEFFSRPNEVLSRRVETWTELAGFIADHPVQMVAGIGYKSLPYTNYFPHALVADNMYLSLLIECGLPGVTALMIFCVTVLVEGQRLAHNNQDGIAGLGRFILAFWLGEMAQMLSGDILTYWRVTPVFLAILGIALRRSRFEPSVDSVR